MRISTLVGLAGLVVATNAAAQDVTWDYATGTDFTRLRTYAWIVGPRRIDPLNDQPIVSAIEAQLAAKGFTKVAPGENPDALVSYYAIFARNLALDEFGTGWGGYRFGETWTNRARLKHIVVGSLMVDIVEATSRTIIWRGLASKGIDIHTSPGSREKRVTEAVERLFRHYPGTEGDS